MDAGIVCINKEKVTKNLEPVKIQPVGQTYLSVLKGYAGISVIFSLFTLIITMFGSFGEEYLPLAITAVVMWCVNPFILSFLGANE